MKYIFSISKEQDEKQFLFCLDDYSCKLLPRISTRVFVLIFEGRTIIIFEHIFNALENKPPKFIYDISYY